MPGFLNWQKDVLEVFANYAEKCHFLLSDGRPYLEAHHVIPLAEGGPDIIENMVALCPNCHRKMHVLKQKEDNEILKKIAQRRRIIL